MAKTGENAKKALSIRAKYTLMMVAILVLLVAAQWLFNRFYLEKLYLRRKLERVASVRETVLEYINADTAENADLEAAELKLRTACEAGGIETMVLKDSGPFAVMLFSTGDDKGGGHTRLFDLLRENGNRNSVELSVYEEGSDYRIYRTRDDRLGTEQIDCQGVVQAGGGDKALKSYYYLLTVPLAEIAETAEIYNRLLLGVGLVTVLVGAGAMVALSGHMTKPIKEITALSRKMADLDFSARYTGGAGDEIHTLGENMNGMAGNLENAMADLKAANAQLEKDVADMAKVNRQRKELLANISHELKTPIAVIQGYSEGLRDGISEDPEMREKYCGIILDEADRMNRLVRQLLSLDELESGTTVTKERFDLAAMLRGEAEAFALKSQQENITLETDVPQTLFVESDEFLLEQVVQNYLSNAFRHVSENGTVRLSCRAKADGGFILSVYNSGEPIPESAMDEIWNKFFKVDKARTRAYGGSGIGLSIVKAAMDNLGGSCSVRNTGDGVEFTAEV